MMKTTLLSSLGLALLSSCAMVEPVNLWPYLERQGIAITQGPPPEGATPQTAILTRSTGYYLFDIVPFWPVDLKEPFDDMVEDAKNRNADGIAYVEYGLAKTPVLGVLFWSSDFTVTGMTYKLPPSE